MRLYQTYRNIIILFALLVSTGASYAFCPPDSSFNDYNTKITMGINAGLLTFKGDVLANNLNISKSSQIGLQLLSFEHRLKGSTCLTISHLSGNLYGDEKSADRNLNFKASFSEQQFGLLYDFSSLFKYSAKKPLFQPFIGAKIAILQFRTYGDLKDANKNTYYYWKDGSIRNLPEGAKDADKSVVIVRDNTFETSLRDQNLDGLGKYRQYALSFPVSVGFMVNITQRLAVRAGFEYHITNTDFIDNITAEGTGNRQGTKGNDNFMYAWGGIYYNFSIKRQDPRLDTNFVLPERPIEEEPVIADSGKPSDNASDSVKTVTPKVPKTPKTKPEVQKPIIKKIPLALQPFDLNNDDIISKEEVNKAIDNFFDKQGLATSKDIEKLIEYFNMQVQK